MYKSGIKYILFILALLCLPSFAFAQKNKKELENKKKKLQSDIQYLNSLLEKTSNNKQSSLGHLMTVNKKISLQEQLIETVSKEIDIIQSQINSSNDTIGYMEGKLGDLKKEYARMVVDAYKTEKGYNQLSFVFASKDFQQAALRMRYLQEYQEYRHQQAIMIDSTSRQIGKKVTHLQQTQDEKKQLLQSMESEKVALASEKGEQQKIYDQLKGREKQYQKELQEKQKASQKLDDAIKKLVADEIKKANARAKHAAGTTTKGTKSVDLKLTPEAQALSQNFQNNKGKLPWPVVQGVITRSFGIYSPMPGITMNNAGVDIATSKGAIARAIFDGVVSYISEDPDYGQVIIIRHGDYFTVYRHLKDVFVKVGDNVKTKQTLGTIAYDEQSQMTHIELQIWKGQNKLDPQDWLFNKD